MNFIINAVDEKGIPNITYTTDMGNTNTENLANAVGLNLIDLTSWLVEYCAAYDAGIPQAIVVDQSITDAIGLDYQPQINAQGVISINKITPGVITPKQII